MMNKICNMVMVGLFLLVLLGCKPSENTNTSEPKIPIRNDSGVKTDFKTERMVWIPPGSFDMGSTKNQDEQPVHKVKLDGFWIGKYEVTNEEFSEFVKDSGYKTIAERKPDPKDFPTIPVEEFKNIKAGSIVFTPPGEDIPVERLKHHNAFMAWWKYVDGASWRFPEGSNKEGVEEKSNHPVVHIAWYDAREYCNWLTRKTGIKHRLPTEAEWEYAARGGLKGKEYIWGDEQEPEGQVMANIWQGRFPRENTKKDGYYTTAPVGKFPPNGYGLFDMAGNVWEWCSDWYMPNYYRNSPVSNPQGPNESYDPNEPGQWKRVQRSGSFLCTDLYCGAFRPSQRMKTTPDTGMSHGGFRVAAEASAPIE